MKFLNFITEDEILNNSKAIGINSILLTILKFAKQPISNHLSKIFNLSFSSGIFPERLKTAKVPTIFKKGFKLECSNHRPISLLSYEDKITKKPMRKTVMQFLNEHNILYQKQFGFQKKNSTARAIIKLIGDIEKSLDNKQSVCAVFIDLPKAFDIADHNILLNKLSHYKIRDTANNWFSSYLANRNQFVTINVFYFDLQNSQLRVPQGSVVEPLLFLLYINDLHNAIDFSSPFHFADDTCILNKQNSVDKINKTLNKDLKELTAMGIEPTTS